MAAIPCGFSIDCRNLAGGDSLSDPNGISDFNGFDFPITNYSTEAPEQVPTFTAPVFPKFWFKGGCLALCVSTVSQNAANLCAMAQEAQCKPGDDGDGGGGGGGGGGGPGTDIFFNQPQTCSFTCADGSQFFYTAPAGIYSAVTQAAANALAYSFACLMAVNTCQPNKPGDPPGQPPVGGGMYLGLIPPGCHNTAYSHQVTASVAASNWSVVGGALPTGLSLNSTGLLSGTPTVAGLFTFVLRAYNVDGNFAQKQYAVCIIAIAPTSFALPLAEVGIAFSQLLITNCAPGTQAWQISSGFLPFGLTLGTTTGLISGTPTMDGTYLFSVSVTGATYSCSKAYAIQVNPCANITTASPLPDADINQPYSEQLASVDLDNPVWTIMAGALPDGLTLSEGGLLSGTPTVEGDFNFTVLATGDNKICSKAFALTVSPGCPEFVTLVGPGLTGDAGVYASSDPLVNRVMVIDRGNQFISFINTSDNTVIQTVAFFGNFAAYANGKFYITDSSVIPADSEIAVYDGDGNFITTIVIPDSLYDMLYSPEQDRVYASYIEAATDNRIVGINPNTDLIDTNTNLGGSGGPPILMYSPNQLFVQTSGGVFTAYSLPAFAPGGSIDTTPGGISGAWAYSYDAGKLYVGAYNGGTFDPEVWEVDPTTLLVDFVFAVDNEIIVNREDDGLLLAADNSGAVTAIKTSDRSTLCTFTVAVGIAGGEYGIAVDAGTGNFYFIGDPTTLCHVYH